MCAAHGEWLFESLEDRSLLAGNITVLDAGVGTLDEQRFGVELSEETISRVEPVRDLLREIGEQIVPAVVHGTLQALPRGNYIPRPGRIQITLGESLDPNEFEKQGVGEEPPERITSALQDQMSLLCKRT